MAWYDQFPIHHGYITQYQGPNTDTPHYADDVETPFHTPITSLFEGDVDTADYQDWGGQVFIRTNVPGIGPTKEYFYHLDDVEVHKGQHVTQGQEIGLSGGQSGYGDHPTDPHWSTGPHTHVGFFTKYKQITEDGKTWKVPYGPDITPYLGTGGGPTIFGFGTSDPCSGCKGADYQKCHAALAAKVGTPPPCAQAGIQRNQPPPDPNDPCSKYPLGWVNPLYVLCKFEQSLGIESNTDLLYRAGFIAGGILFIIFGLMIFSRSFMSGVQASASQVV